MADSKYTRRDFLKTTIASSSALVAPTIINYLGHSSPSSDKEFLEIREGNFYLGGDEYVIKGANYQPKNHPWETFKNYAPEEIEKELQIAEDLGINSLRVAINYQYSTNNVEWEKPFSHVEVDENYLKNFNDFLERAHDKNMKVMPILFGQMYWSLYEPRKRQFVEEYLENLIPNFSDDERIIAWDTGNEQELLFDDIGREKVLSLVKNMSLKVKSLDKNHPITIGWRNGKSLGRIGDVADFHSFHNYDFASNIGKVARNHTYDKPLVLQEFGLPTKGVDYGSENHQKNYYEKSFDEAKQSDLEGTMFWTLMDFPEKLKKEEKNPFLPEQQYEYYMGILRTDYYKKPAAHVVEQYYKWIL